MVESRQIDIYFSNIFFNKLFYPSHDIYLWNLEDIDPVLHNSLIYLLDYASNNDSTLEDLDIRFVWMNKDGSCDELCHNGSEILVTNQNISTYIHKLINYKYIEGFDRIFSLIRDGLRYFVPDLILWPTFYPEEFKILLSGDNQEWTLKDLEDHIIIQNYYTRTFPVIMNFFQILSEFNEEERKQFLMFMTSKTRLPFGGLANLNPPLTIVPYFTEPNHPPFEVQDKYIPVAATCFHMLRLPSYSSYEVLKSKLMYAIKEGQGVFGIE
ncbi:E3 ubiquitin-protein ligase TRIP12 [Thelohanellus kitauei]|uniref:E3 ubiquitin-protein ligase n=1 Tax=Thelohanellus kitauei TaxID=669202 RepID=A0A0C2JB49_THEKT|nr:E3 ubiquitin-protein ligase TRIP12 [Thelohanellus kitauei]